MNIFKIHNIGGEVIAEGSPRYTSTFGQPDCIEFSTISSPKPIDFAVGCYVDYDSNESGLGYPGRYMLYTIPQVTKQARRDTCGEAFVYSNVQFFAPTKQLERRLFRDIVKYDNNIHFSTRENISTYENVAGIAARIEACMNAPIGTATDEPWHVEVLSYSDAEFSTLVGTPKEFAVSAGATCLDVLNEIYKIWKGIGWVYEHRQDGHHIILGRPNIREEENTTTPFLYGKGRGLKVIKRSISSAQDFATRIYAYGSTRNLISRYYNSKNISNAESVDIPNLMIPISQWGKTDGLPDGRKAFLQNDEAVSKFGEVEKVIYFDGSGDYDEIYPSIEGVTFADVRAAMSPTDEYYPAMTDRYPDADRIDAVKTGTALTDNGVYMGSEDGSSVIESGDYNYWLSGRNYTFEKGEYVRFSEIVDLFILGNVTGKGRLTLNTQGWSWRYLVSGSAEVRSLNGFISITVGDDYILTDSFPVELSDDGTYHIDFSAYKSAFTGRYETGGQVIVRVGFYGAVSNTTNTTTFTYISGETSPKCHWEATYALPETFAIELKQIGFDISKQATTASNGIGTIAMKDGKCGGREFVIKSCTYNMNRDSWDVVCYRQNDTSISQYFPNADYQIAEGDHFVFTDITMPPLYIEQAENRLLREAQRVLETLSKPKYVYEPEVDPIKQKEDNTYLVSGRYMCLVDTDIIDGGTDYILIDSVTVTYNEYSIPTLRVTLRDEKVESFFQQTARAQYKTNREVTGVKNRTGAQTPGIVTKSDGGDDSGAIVLNASAIINALGYTPAKQADIPNKVGQLENDKGYITGISYDDIVRALGYTPSSEQFLLAYYNSTWYSSILQAYNERKDIVCAELTTNGAVFYTLYKYTEKKGAMPAYFTFTAIADNGAMYTAYINSNNVWSKDYIAAPTSPTLAWLTISPTEVYCDKENGYQPDTSTITVRVYKQVGDEEASETEEYSVQYAFYSRLTHEPSSPLSLVGKTLALSTALCSANYKVQFRLIKDDMVILHQDVLFLSNGINGSDGKDGQDGKDGEDGKDGQDGADGANGRAGAAVRGPVEWFDGQMGYRRFSNGEETEYPEDALWIDVVRYGDQYYVCKTAFQNQDIYAWDDVSSYFEPAGQTFDFVATRVLLAENAGIKFLSGNEIYLMSGSNITGGARGASETSDVIFWAGGNGPTSPDNNFIVHQDGTLEAVKGAIGPWELNSEGIIREIRTPSGQITRQSLFTTSRLGLNWNNVQRFSVNVEGFSTPILEVEAAPNNSSHTAIRAKGDVVQDGNRVVDSVADAVKHIEVVTEFPDEPDPNTLYIKTA